jgi:hypothetical protein
MLKIDVPCLCDGLFFLIVVILIKIIDSLFYSFDGFLFLVLTLERFLLCVESANPVPYAIV